MSKATPGPWISRRPYLRAELELLAIDHIDQAPKEVVDAAS